MYPEIPDTVQLDHTTHKLQNLNTHTTPYIYSLRDTYNNYIIFYM